MCNSNQANNGTGKALVPIEPRTPTLVSLVNKFAFLDDGSSENEQENQLALVEEVDASQLNLN